MAEKVGFLHLIIILATGNLHKIYKYNVRIIVNLNKLERKRHSVQNTQIKRIDLWSMLNFNNAAFMFVKLGHIRCAVTNLESIIIS